MRDLFEGLDDMTTEESSGAAERTPEQMADAPKKKSTTPKKKVAKKKVAKAPKATKTATKTAKAPTPDAGDDSRKKRTVRPYPDVAFRDATQVGDAIFKYASGEKVRRLTLLEKMDRKPTASTTQRLITNSGKYGVTSGSYIAEYLELEPLGKVACDPASDARSRLEARFKLSIEGVAPFSKLYESYKNKKLPAHEVMKDTLDDADIDVDDSNECIDLFVVNVKDLGLLRTIAGSEHLVSIEQALEELGNGVPALPSVLGADTSDKRTDATGKKSVGSKWDTICFYITPIGDEGTPARKHSDLFLSMLVEPALKDLGLEVIRADKIAEPGMITSNILEYLKFSRLVIADLSLLNPNVFYEMALRHAVKMPIVQIIQKADKLPFDVGQVKSIVIDNSDIYTFTPKLETYRSEITTLAKSALDDPAHVGNPITVFFPAFWN